VSEAANAVAGATVVPARELAACRDVTVSYGDGDTQVVALAAANLSLASGEFVTLVGDSGSGKSTLLHVLGGLVTPESGMVTWKGEPLSSLDAAARGQVRAGGIAYVFQGANLIPHLTAWENLAFALSVATAPADGPVDPDEALALVGLQARAGSLPEELSGGEQQRVAIARAIVQQPELLLCDEPTGHLDSDTGARVLDMLAALQGQAGFALVVATHDPDIAARANRTVRLAEGRIQRAPA
jgi:putative ABC transport system ATP-binding protein